MERQYYIYFLTNSSQMLYIGVTNNLLRRLYEHKKKLIDGFTKKYNITRLVYVEISTNIFEALEREKQLKKWNRKKKIALIESMNPQWCDLSKEWMG